MSKEIIHDVCLFVDGVASVSDDPNIIAEKALARFGKKTKASGAVRFINEDNDFICKTVC